MSKTYSSTCYSRCYSWVHSIQRIFQALAVWLILFPGCASQMDRMSQWISRGWIGDYDTAERQSQETDRPILYHYLNPRGANHQALKKIWTDGQLEPALEKYVCCRLYSSYEPDRRYVAQFGVTKPPALIIWHRDGTYHAAEGAITRDELLAFLVRAQSPGDQPTINPLIPRQPDYHWLISLEAAKAEKATHGKSQLIVYFRSMTQDWSQLKKLFAQREVWRALRGWTHVRIGVMPWNGKSYDTKLFGQLRLPAIIAVQPDGRYGVLERPDSSLRIAWFLRTGEGSTTPTAPASTTPKVTK